MSENAWPVLAISVLVLAWVISKVWHYMKVSEQQWREVDKSKLKTWDDEDD